MAFTVIGTFAFFFFFLEFIAMSQAAAMEVLPVFEEYQ
jgi:hypothetical protein